MRARWAPRAHRMGLGTFPSTAPSPLHAPDGDPFCVSLFPSPKRCLPMPLEADRLVVLSLSITFTHYLNECDPYHMVATSQSSPPASPRTPTRATRTCRSRCRRQTDKTELLLQCDRPPRSRTRSPRSASLVRAQRTTRDSLTRRATRRHLPPAMRELQNAQMRQTAWRAIQRTPQQPPKELSSHRTTPAARYRGRPCP